MTGTGQQGGSPPWKARSVAILLAYAVLVSLPGTFSVPPLDRDESRFVQATTQMLETGDFINIRFQEGERNKKPVGIYWLQAASVTLLSDVEAREIWAYRMPSLVAALLSVFLAYLLAVRLFDEQIAFWGAFLLASAPGFAGEATIAKTDGVLLASIIATQAALGMIFLKGLLDREKPGFWIIAAFWVALAAGILLKGPVAPMVSFLTIALLAAGRILTDPGTFRHVIRWLFWFRPFTGFLILAVLTGPWLAAIAITTEGRFFAEALGTDMLGKVSQVQESHAGPPGYYVITLFLMFWPAGLFLPVLLRDLVRHLAVPGVLFSLAWLIPGWLVFELASTKLPHYTLPLYPALAFLIVYCLFQLDRGGKRAENYYLVRGLGSFLYLAATLAACGLMIWFPREYSSAGIQAFHYGFAALTLAGALWAVFNMMRFELKQALRASCLVTAMVVWFLFEGMLPGLDRLGVSYALSETLDEADLHPLRDGAEPVALAGYYEPSAIFLLGTETKAQNADVAARWIRSKPGRVAIIEKRDEKTFLEKTGSTQIRQLALIEGFNYSNGKDVTLTIYISE